MEFPFSDHVALMDGFLIARPAIVDNLERQLFSARGKAHAQNGDRESIAEIFDTCFFESPAIPRHLSGLKGQLEAAHRADGFEPAAGDGYSRELDPVELALRACHHWNRDRWPGRNGRLAYAQSLYAVFILRQLEHLILRIWDEDRRSSIVDRPSSSNRRAAAEDQDLPVARLRQVQRLLGLLNTGSLHSHGIRLVSDARWLIQTAQGPLTRHVEPYLIKARHVASSFTATDRIEIHKAGAVLAGGHLRSQLRRLAWRTGWASDDPRLLALTRSSNSMDLALLIGDLVPLLEAYSTACVRQDEPERLMLADALLQGLSADPELLLARLDLLGPSTLIEDLFVDCGHVGVTPYTAAGAAHQESLARYGELIGRTAESLRQDCLVLDPVNAAYSPLGIVYGFCADLVSNMVLNTLVSPSSPDLGLEDMFNSRGRLEEKRTRADQWTRLPKRQDEPDPFERSTEWTAQMHARMSGALDARAACPTEPNASPYRTARLYVAPRGVALDPLTEGVLPAGTIPAQEHCLTSDAARARTTGSTVLPADRLSADRAEGRLLACVMSDGAWFGVSKVPLTLYASQGKDALITDVPSGVIDVLEVVCPELLHVIHD